MAKMSKRELLDHIHALYQAFNMADSDNEDRPDWAEPNMARSCCQPLDAILRIVLPAYDDREDFYANL